MGGRMQHQGSDSDARQTVAYTVRRAYEGDAFHQFPLLDPSRLRREAEERGLRIPIDPYEELERLDREGAFSPLLFDADRVVFRDEEGFVPWADLAVDDATHARPRAHPMYSPWQLLYLRDALRLDKAEVNIEWVLDDQKRASVHPVMRDWYERQLARWRELDASWHELMMVLFRLQGIYGPSIKGTLTKATVSMVYDESVNDFVDPRDRERPWDPASVLSELGVTAETVKEMYEGLATKANSSDPLRYWYMLFRMAPAKQRARLRGEARRAHDAYDAALILRPFYRDLAGELLLAPDEIFDVSDKSWKKRLFGRWPLERYTRADLAVELRTRQLNPHEVHLVVEGATEHAVCRQVLEEIAGMPLNDMGVTVQELQGVGKLRKEALRAVKTFPRFLVLIADREGDIEEEVERLIAEGILTEEAVQLWDTSFEEANFSDEELVGMINALGRERGATLTLDAETLRSKYNEHRDRARRNPQGLATFACKLAAMPEFGSVKVSKTALAPLMADRILQDLRESDEEEVIRDRPVAKTLISIFRVT